MIPLIQQVGKRFKKTSEDRKGVERYQAAARKLALTVSVNIAEKCIAFPGQTCQIDLGCQTVYAAAAVKG